MNMKNVLVIGAGAAGMIAAGTAAKNGCAVVLLERNEKVGRKIMITGKGRCNVTNATFDTRALIEQVPRNGRFLFGAFNAFTAQDTIDFFESLGVPVKVERGNRVFPASDKAVDIVDALNRYITINGVKRRTSRVSSLLIQGNAATGVVLENGEELLADSVIVATGGISYPKTGSTGDGYAFAKQAGHTVIEPVPSLVALECREGFCGEAMGLSLRNIAIKVKDTHKNKWIYTDFGEMLFTHFGASGPVILSASAHMREMEPCQYEIYIDLKPALEEEKLDARLLRDLNENCNKAISNSLGMLLPRAIINPILRISGVKTSTKCNQLTKEERQRLIHTIKNLRLTVLRFRPVEEAVVTSGGVKTAEIDPKTMQSKLCQNLYFAGEVIDVDAYTGGFNLQIAFSTGFVAGNAQ